MKTLLSLLTISLLSSVAALAEHHATAAGEDYPLDTCVVSDEKLGDMGEVVYYTYKADGQPDREVRFCCKMCIARFKKDPATYLAKIDAASRGHAHPATSEAKACCAEGECDAHAGKGA